MSLWESGPHPGGGLVLADLPPYVVELLLSLPELLDAEQPDAVRDRLYPAPQQDEQAREDWKRLMAPELFALLASARDIVARDLEGLERTAAEGEPRLLIPSEHVHAWIRALNIGRLTLGALNTLGATDMEEWPPVDEDPARAEAVLQVNLLGEIQGLLIHGVTEWADDEEDDDDDLDDDESP